MVFWVCFVMFIRFCLVCVWYKVMVNVLVVLVCGVLFKLSRCLIMCWICVLFVLFFLIIDCLICFVLYLVIGSCVWVVVIMVVFLVWLSFSVELGFFVINICLIVNWLGLYWWIILLILVKILVRWEGKFVVLMWMYLFVIYISLFCLCVIKL